MIFPFIYYTLVSVMDFNTLTKVIYTKKKGRAQ